MPSKENLAPEDLRLRELRARRTYLTARLQRVQDLTAANRLLRVQIALLRQCRQERQEIAFLRQCLRERQENLDCDSEEAQEESDSEGDQEERKE